VSLHIDMLLLMQQSGA